ncbi:hypothetical protein A2630_02955 [Candidatus Woesebacteria bacterium RIFCSPHIGHO2_01_FULL_44_10]|uniref:HD domain-containing protein n=1 Tax=Candidatus Woesebacteria bacterium RIFCSPLOWO2_01_FULL_44_14 TaxID=1802525 RepID=A0A1F8C486_9BACT|nr:MAG: hypothetical protein A2630_02955 [Candidatus Woesebacteria bacterium RIFCSPHIGHO2_01_FULL_44_10]OGM70528.1 MAG: hypothetical protein A2975_01985 [Candidatus Woesebacteria bacterium RIFCSPLOWO2_01_FULL_44_14]
MRGQETLVNIEILWEALKPQRGTSHGPEHSKMVSDYALQLHQIHGGDLEVIKAAAILHDAGREDTNLHGAESIGLSVQKAKEIMTEAHWPENFIDLVVQAIQEHDQPDHSPTSIEGKILKDADFLAGFGAIGIMRTFMWTGESGRSVDEALHRLRVTMVQRINGLEFTESKILGQRLYIEQVAPFLEAIDHPPPLFP